MRVDDTIALIVENVREGEKFEEAGFAGAGLADDIDVAGAVATKEAELVVDAAEIGEAEGGDVFVVGGVAGQKREFRGGFGGFGRGPDDVGGLDASVGEVIDAGELADVQNKAVVGEGAHFVSVEGGRFKRTRIKHFETVKISGIILLESPD